MFTQHEDIDLNQPDEDYEYIEEVFAEDDGYYTEALAQSNFNTLPLEVIIKIFIHLDTISLCAVLWASRGFNLFAKTNEIWEKPILDHKIVFTSDDDDKHLNYKIFAAFANKQCGNWSRENKFYFNTSTIQDKKLVGRYFKELISTSPSSYLGQKYLWSAVAFDQGDETFKTILLNQPGYIETLKNDLLIHAVDINKINTARLLLEIKANPNPCPINTPLLLRACNHNNLEMAELLLKYGARVDDYTNNKTLLFHAASKGNIELVKLLCGNGANVNAEQEYNFSILFASIVSGQESVVDFLLKKGADLLKKDNLNNTALHFAAGQGFDKIITLLMEHETGRELVNQANDHGVTPLMLAVQSGNEKSCLKLLKNHANLKLETIRGHTAFHFGWFCQHIHIIKILLEYGSDCRRDTLFYTRMESLLFIALFFLSEETKKRAQDMVRILCEEGIDLERVNADGIRPLYWSLYYDNLPVANILLEYGADINALSNGQWFPLRLAVTQENVELCDFLIKKGADVNIHFGPMRTSLLHLAANKESQKIITLLIQAGACPLAKNSLGKTPSESAFTQKFKLRLAFLERLAAHFKNDTDIQIYPKHGRYAKTQLEFFREEIQKELNEDPYNPTLNAWLYLFLHSKTQLQRMITLYVFHLTYSQSEKDLRINQPAIVLSMTEPTLYFKIEKELKLYLGQNEVFFNHLENYVIQPLMEGLNKPACNKEEFNKAFLCLSFLERSILKTNKINCFDFAEKIFNILEQFPAIKGAHHLEKYIEKILEGYGNNQEKLASIVDVVKETYELIRKGAKSSALFLGSSKLGDKLQTCMRDELGCSMPFYIVVEPKNGRFFSL